MNVIVMTNKKYFP